MSKTPIAVTDSFFVAPQIQVDDVAAAAKAGYTLIINNRPDGEMPGQPRSVDLEKAAKEAGIEYAFLPVDSSGITPTHTAGLEQAIDDAPNGKTLAFCRSGMRSVMVWSYAEARFGKPVDQIIEEARNAGFDIAGHEPALTALHDAGKAPRTDPPV